MSYINIDMLLPFFSKAFKENIMKYKTEKEKNWKTRCFMYKKEPGCFMKEGEKGIIIELQIN